MRTVRWADSSAIVTVTATSDELADTVMAAAIDGAIDETEPATTTAEVGFGHLRGDGARRSTRRLAVAPRGTSHGTTPPPPPRRSGN